MFNKLLLITCVYINFQYMPIYASSITKQQDDFMIGQDTTSKNLLNSSIFQENDYLKALLKSDVTNHLRNYITIKGFKKTQDKNLNQIFAKNNNILGQSISALQSFQELADCGYVPAMNALAAEFVKYEQYE